MVMERSKAGMIPCAERGPLSRIPDYEGKLTLEPKRAVLAPNFVGAEHNFGIGTTAKSGSLGPELIPEFRQIVKVPVEDQHQISILGNQRLGR